LHAAIDADYLGAVAIVANVVQEYLDAALDDPGQIDRRKIEAALRTPDDGELPHLFAGRIQHREVEPDQYPAALLFAIQRGRGYLGAAVDGLVRADEAMEDKTGIPVGPAVNPLAMMKSISVRRRRSRRSPARCAPSSFSPTERRSACGGSMP
jgi:hypothetical protein